MRLYGEDFIDASLSEDILLLSIEGENYNEIKSRIDLDNKIPIKLYDNVIINFIVRNDKFAGQLLEIYEYFKNYRVIFRVCIESKQDIDLKMDIIAYK